jgi:tetratricopeptide (TPR) repeat protein
MKAAARAIPLIANAATSPSGVLASASDNGEPTEEEVRQALLEKARFCREAGARHELSQALASLADIEGDPERFHEARALGEEAVSIARDLTDAVLLANGLRKVGNLLRRFGRREQAETCYQEALVLFRSHAEPPPLDFARIVRSLALLREEAGSYAAAQHLWEKARQLYSVANARKGVAESRDHLNLVRRKSEEGVLSDADRVKLLEVIRDRPVCLVLHGHSLKDLPRYIDKFPDVCFASVNRYWAIEQFIQPRQLELAMVISEEVLEQFRSKVKAFPSLLISLDRINDGVAYSCPGGATLYGFLKLLIKNRVERVFLFGADGYSASAEPYVDGYLSGSTAKVNGHRRDTENFNSNFPQDHGDTQIFNVSLDSKYTVLPKISYEECVSLLNAS